MVRGRSRTRRTVVSYRVGSVRGGAARRMVGTTSGSGPIALPNPAEATVGRIERCTVRDQLSSAAKEAYEPRRRTRVRRQQPPGGAHHPKVQRGTADFARPGRGGRRGQGGHLDPGGRLQD